MNIETMLSKDFAALTRRLVNDAFVARTLKRVGAAERLRLVAVGGAGAAGAALAASQFGALAATMREILPSMSDLVVSGAPVQIDLGAAPLLATTLLFALVGGATALIVPGAR